MPKDKWRQSQKTTTEHNGEINRLWGAQHQWAHHRSCISDAGNIDERGKKDYKTQNTKRNAMNHFLPEIKT